MSSNTPKRPTGGANARKTDRSNPRVNRARVQAMESRSASTIIDSFSTDESILETAAVPLTGRSAAAISRRKSAPKTFAIPRSLEYTYIRSDLQRLLITAGGLFVLMIILLIVLD